MKIELEIPDWAGQGALYLLSGIEIVAYKRVERKNWVVKKSRCKTTNGVNCGKCCQTNTPLGLGAFFKAEKDKPCIFVGKDKSKPEFCRCLLGLERPFICCVSGGDPVSHIVRDPPDCTESFEELK